MMLASMPHNKAYFPTYGPAHPEISDFDIQLLEDYQLDDIGLDFLDGMAALERNGKEIMTLSDGFPAQRITNLKWIDIYLKWISTYLYVGSSDVTALFPKHEVCT